MSVADSGIQYYTQLYLKPSFMTLSVGGKGPSLEGFIGDIYIYSYLYIYMYTLYTYTSNGAPSLKDLIHS